MVKKLLLTIILSLTLAACTTQSSNINPSNEPIPAINGNRTASPSPTIRPTQKPQLPQSKTIPKIAHYAQTFNNCGPATYSMMLLYQNLQVSQKELGDELRPYQIPNGDNDDKSVTMKEIANHAKNYNLQAYYRPNGTLELLKQFIAVDTPVALRVWLNDKDDIGHFIIIRGYDDSTQKLIFDDSYYGPDRALAYETILSRWQPFNYEYMVLTQNPQQIEAILGEEKEIQKAWQNAVTRNQKEQDRYPQFNLSVAYFELGDYQKSIEYYEKVQAQLPGRMLWYQLQPIEAYLKVGNHQKVFELTDKILNNHNRAYSELYYIRAQSYIAQGKKESAKAELDLAIKYNKNYQAAKDLLNTL